MVPLDRVTTQRRTTSTVFSYDATFILPSVIDTDGPDFLFGLIKVQPGAGVRREKNGLTAPEQVVPSWR